jgi:hypothetical protein
MQRYTVYLFLETALHISGRISTHRQEHIQLYLQHLPQVPDAVYTVIYVPDDGWRYHPKYVQQFPEINKLCNVAFCWIYIWISRTSNDLLFRSLLNLLRIEKMIRDTTVIDCNACKNFLATTSGKSLVCKNKYYISQISHHAKCVGHCLPESRSDQGMEQFY